MSTENNVVAFKVKSGESSPLVHATPVLHMRLLIDPAQAEHRDDTFTLKSSDGSYERKLTVADDFVPGDEFVDLLFDGLKRSLKYTLEVDPGEQGEPHNLFEELSYQELLDFYSIIEPGDTLEPEEEEEESAEASGSETDWEDEGGGGSEWGGDAEKEDFDLDQWRRSTGDYEDYPRWGGEPSATPLA